MSTCSSGFHALSIAAAIFVSGFFCSTALAEEPSVAIVLTAQVNLDTVEGDRLVNGLGDSIARKHKAVAIPAAKVRAAAADVGATCASNPECTRELGKKLGARYLLFVAAVKLGGEIQLDPVWVRAGGAFAVRERQTLAAQMRVEDIEKVLTPIIPLGDLELRVKEAKPRRMTKGAWWAGGAAVTAAVVSASFGVWAITRSDDCEGGDGCSPDEEDSMISDVEQRTLVSDVFLATSVIAGVTAGILYYRSNSEDEESVSVGVIGGRDSLGLSFGGRF